MLKKFLIILGIFLILVSGYAFAEENITVLVNGDPLISDVPAQEVPVYDKNGAYLGDRVMLPLRAVGEKLNCDVYWNQETEGITLYRKGSVTMMWIGKESGFLMEDYGLSKHYLMDVPPTLMEERTMVPVRATAELLGATVDWIEETNTVSISYDLGELEENAGAAEFFQLYGLFLHEQYDDYVAYFSGKLNTITGYFELTDGRKIKFELFPQFAPQTCQRFMECAKSGFYNNTIFHRVIEGFVAQGGGFDKKLEPKDVSDYQNLYGEFLANGHFNLLPHSRGVLSFARTNEYDGGGTQFFIVHQDASFLNGEYASFGRITSGMGAVDAICTAETDEYDIPTRPVVIKTVVIDEK